MAASAKNATNYTLTRLFVLGFGWPLQKQKFRTIVGTTRPSKQCKSLIDVLILKKYLKKNLKRKSLCFKERKISP